MGMCVDPRWGGAGADFVSYALATEEIAAGDCGLANMMCVNNSPNCAALADHGSDEQKARFLRPLASVITSYSIHYTKLYERATARFSTGTDWPRASITAETPVLAERSRGSPISIARILAWSRCW